MNEGVGLPMLSIDSFRSIILLIRVQHCRLSRQVVEDGYASVQEYI